MSVRIISDSTSDIGVEKANEWGVTLVPLKVLFGDKEYRDGVDLSLERFYEILEEGGELPTTSQPSPDAFVEIFDEIKAAGDEAVVMTISSELSGTYQSACIAKEICGYDKIYVIDSKLVTLSLQLLVRRAMELREEGKNGKEIAGLLESDKKNFSFYGVIGDLSFLERGGRLPKSGAVVGSMLNLKPIIKIKEDGKIKLVGVARGLNGAFSKILKMAQADGADLTGREYCIGYTGKPEVLEPLEAYLDGKLGKENRLTSSIGTVIGTHGGPGCRVFAFSKKR
ncbi:DegV family EDD domain-containing protein [Clostridium sp. MCC353]|uniref:DegV family protein n=1 Tax=Clostridium sp. MCC353 TaxID=2592646 RepID=UPI001C00B8A0|nr:DegV family protein [Clostridium sp. MCC353]MBT9776531.1 DegV family EDD domain-containing protein [Clostridium sp. MCC353]